MTQEPVHTTQILEGETHTQVFTPQHPQQGEGEASSIGRWRALTPRHLRRPRVQTASDQKQTKGAFDTNTPIREEIVGQSATELPHVSPAA